MFSLIGMHEGVNDRKISRKNAQEEKKKWAVFRLRTEVIHSKNVAENK